MKEPREPLRIFNKNVRTNRTKTLVEILGAVATSKNPISRFTIQKRLQVRVPGVKRTTYGDYAYSNIHKNTKFLEQKDFLRITQDKPGRVFIPLYDVTVKGALASLSSSFINESNESKWLDSWRLKDWGQGYDEPFSNVKNVSELRKIVETICLGRNSLEDVSEDILKRNLRDPDELERLIKKGKIEVTIKGVTTRLIPDSVTMVKAENEPKVRAFTITPDLDTSRVFSDLIANDPNFLATVQPSLLAIVRTLGHCFIKKEKGENAHIYLSDSRMSVLGFTIPEEVRLLLPFHQKAVEFARDAFEMIITHFLKDPEFVQGKKPLFIYGAMKYDPLKRELAFLKPIEMKEEASKFLKQLG